MTGAVLDVALRAPRTDRLGGKLNINLLGADALIEGPVNADQSFYFAARRSYADLLIKQIENNGITIQVPKYFELNNVYQRKNVAGYSYDPTYTSKDPVYPFVLPFSFGVQAEF